LYLGSGDVKSTSESGFSGYAAWHLCVYQPQHLRWKQDIAVGIISTGAPEFDIEIQKEKPRRKKTQLSYE
jgi:hypothetical protein